MRLGVVALAASNDADRTRRRRVRVGVVLAFALLLSVPAASPQEARPREVSLVVYHVAPDPAAGTPDADPFSGVLTGFLTGPDVRLPLTRVDNATTTSDAPEGDPASAGAHFQELRRLVQERQRAGSPVTMHLDARIEAGRAQGRVFLSPELDAEPFRFRIVLVEDGLRHDGRSHRFVARAIQFVPEVGPKTFDFALDPAWNEARLGIVGVVEWAGTGQAFQSAVWIAGEPAVAQREKAVLVEHVTATWCEPCAASDAAIDLLASQFGFPADARPGGQSYWVAPSPWGLAGLAAGALAGFVLIGRRAA